MGLKIIDCFEVMAICGQGKWSSTEWRSPVKIWGPWFNHDCEPWSLLLFPLFQVRVVRFYRNCFDSIFFFLLLLLLLLPYPLLPRPPCRSSTASSWSQWTAPDLHCQSQWAVLDLYRRVLISLGSAGPQLPEGKQERMPKRVSQLMPDSRH